MARLVVVLGGRVRLYALKMLGTMAAVEVGRRIAESVRVCADQAVLYQTWTNNTDCTDSGQYIERRHEIVPTSHTQVFVTLSPVRGYRIQTI